MTLALHSTPTKYREVHEAEQTHQRARALADAYPSIERMHDQAKRAKAEFVSLIDALTTDELIEYTNVYRPAAQ